jgi:hypothetical protein
LQVLGEETEALEVHTEVLEWLHREEMEITQMAQAVRLEMLYQEIHLSHFHL